MSEQVMRLENWYPYQVSENKIRLIGNSYGDPRREEGKEVITSYLVSGDGLKVTTQSGSVYALGKPSEITPTVFKAHGIRFFPEAPFGFLPGSKVV